MCGIAGIINFNNQEVEAKSIREMCSVMEHRGPDTSGIYLKNNIGMGHQRLAIIDLSDTANQPMSNGNKTIWLVFNGEIYNFEELRKILEKNGHCFKSKTDSEVVVHGYEEWGTKIFEKLDGMFALAILDENNKKLFLAKGRFGKKPLFFYQNEQKLIFASDPKAITKVLETTPELSLKAIDCYLRYLYVPGCHSIFKDITKVPHGHFLEFNFSGKCISHQYWDISYFDKYENFGEEQYLNIIEEKLNKAVEKRLQTDVPLGVLLSGGVDSSLITALWARMSKERVRTFSVIFHEEKYDESRYSRMVAKKYNTIHTEVVVNHEDILDILPKLIWYHGEPFADSSAIPCYLVFRELAKHNLKVALTGDGGDEVFGGYFSIRAAYFLEIYRKLAPQLLRTFSAGLFNSLSKYLKFDWRGDSVRHLYRFIEHGSLSPAGAYLSTRNTGWISPFRENLYSPEFQRMLSSHNSMHLYLDIFEQAKASDNIDRYLYSNMQSQLIDDYLVKIDIASMSNSIEARSPFLDYKLAEFTSKIPSSILVKGGTQKYLLKKIASKYLPEELIYRKKMGFSIPLENWMAGPLKNALPKLLLNGSLIKTGLFNKAYLNHILERTIKREENHTERIWSFLWFEIWFRIFIEKTLAPDSSLRELIK